MNSTKMPIMTTSQNKL